MYVLYAFSLTSLLMRLPASLGRINIPRSMLGYLHRRRTLMTQGHITLPRLQQARIPSPPPQWLSPLHPPSAFTGTRETTRRRTPLIV